MQSSIPRPPREPLPRITAGQLDTALRELDIRPPGPTRYELVSRWAAKFVWRVEVQGQTWAYVRALLGPGSAYPDRWRHLQLGVLLNEARVGPRMLGITPESEALGGRAVAVEAALLPLERDVLEARAGEAITLFTRLHSSDEIHHELLRLQTVAERARQRQHPIRQRFFEVRERWFEAVVPRWLEAGLRVINDLAPLVGELFYELETIPYRDGEMEALVVPVHNDPNAGNFMLNRRGSLRLIDFENIALDNPVADLGLFLTWFADTDQHADLLKNYPLADPEAVLEWMQIWVPLRYLDVAAHWAARLTRARDEEAWEFAVESVDDWLRGAAEIVYGGELPLKLDSTLHDVRRTLIARGPLVGVGQGGGTP